mmetsp:Transcript_413/g.757  ORF Transcript_413/g.757 Transcript_413/m.757 type:complete len:548 (+) Transcript_413:63-1706(+)
MNGINDEGQKEEKSYRRRSLFRKLRKSVTNFLTVDTTALEKQKRREARQMMKKYEENGESSTTNPTEDVGLTIEEQIKMTIGDNDYQNNEREVIVVGDDTPDGWTMVDVHTYSQTVPINIYVLGDDQSGKSSIIKKIISNEILNKEYVHTETVTSSSKYIEISQNIRIAKHNDDGSYELEKCFQRVNVDLNLIEVPVSKMNNIDIKEKIASCDGIMLVFDINLSSTINAVDRWRRVLGNLISHRNILLCAHKSDVKESHHVISPESLFAYAREAKLCGWHMTTAKLKRGNSITQAFNYLLKLSVKYKVKQQQLSELGVTSFKKKERVIDRIEEQTIIEEFEKSPYGQLPKSKGLNSVSPEGNLTNSVHFKIDNIGVFRQEVVSFYTHVLHRLRELEALDVLVIEATKEQQSFEEQLSNILHVYVETNDKLDKRMKLQYAQLQRFFYMECVEKWCTLWCSLRGSYHLWQGNDDELKKHLAGYLSKLKDHQNILVSSSTSILQPVSTGTVPSDPYELEEESYHFPYLTTRLPPIGELLPNLQQFQKELA